MILPCHRRLRVSGDGGHAGNFVKELRGDVRHEAIDIYNHIDKKS